MSTPYEKMEAKREEYTAVQGQTYPEPKNVDAPVVTAQPSATSNIESYVLDLDASQVNTWSVQDVINQFVDKIGLGYCNEMFMANKINGRSLMLLREEHL